MPRWDRYDLTGQKFGRLTFVREDGRIYRSVAWLTKCDCGNYKRVRATLVRNGQVRSCGCLVADVARLTAVERRGSRNHNWRGGTVVNSQGYTLRVVQPDDSLYETAVPTSKTGTTRRMLEHRYVMARHIGRPLKPTEIVHHINGKRSDNRIQNLELWSVPHPPGQRITGAAGL